ncbi:MAG: GNAT family N-acetyltransferase [Bacteroidota bacterium]|nr:GNAT family N-acetyltransferase [Bacteroidota bacterium]MDP4232797.1 GNAT family N-acetyltransferase [Bacteroidota bacterium]MDP4242522.1 GNAT family N-acetyltransferase [Bacteroidota bacterium]MDP4289203.1 GNAT family N-acetyltransferase [Bacteroidota bacterium]
MIDLEIREFGEHDSISELTQLVRIAYKRLGDMGLQFWGTWQTDDVTRDRISDADQTLIALRNREMIATISLYPSRPESRCEYYRQAWCFGQFAVKPDLQRTGIGSHLLNLVEERARMKGASYIALDTAETAYHLIEYYEKRGYSFVQHQQWDRVNYRSVVMSKNLQL